MVGRQLCGCRASSEHMPIWQKQSLQSHFAVGFFDVTSKNECCAAIVPLLCRVADKSGQDFWFNGVLVNLDIQALNLDEALFCIKKSSSHSIVEEEEECPICLDCPLQVSCKACSMAYHCYNS